MHSIILRKSLISSGILLPKRKSKRLTKYGLAIMIRYVLNCQNVLVACYEKTADISRGPPLVFPQNNLGGTTAEIRSRLLGSCRNSVLMTSHYPEDLSSASDLDFLHECQNYLGGGEVWEEARKIKKSLFRKEIFVNTRNRC